MSLYTLITGLLSNTLARSSLIVFAGTMTANVLSYLYHLIMGRLLGPSGYGELSSLLSLIYIFAVPLMVAQTVLVKFVSGFKARGEVGQSKSLFLKATKIFAIISVVLFPIVLLVSPLITEYLHLSNTTLFTLVYVLLVFSLLSVATSSMLTGYQKFIWVSSMGALAILVKIVVSIPLVVWGVTGVMVAAVISSILIYTLFFIPLKFVLSVKAKPTKLKKRDAFGFAVPTLLTQLGITSLYSTDIILVRHYFSAHDAGLYAALAVLGKIIFFASSAVPLVLFPIASERYALGTKTRKLVLSGVAAVALISGGITALYFLFPGLIIRLLFGTAFTGGEHLLGQFAVFLALFSVGNILALANLATGKMGIWIIPVVAAVLQIIGITVFHGSIAQVIMLDIAVAAIFALGASLYYLYEKV